MDQFPKDAEEQRFFDGYSKRVDPWVRVGCLFAPLLLWPVWGIMHDVFGPEGAVGIVIVAQLVLLAGCADTVIEKLAQRALLKRRREKLKM